MSGKQWRGSVLLCSILVAMAYGVFARSSYSADDDASWAILSRDMSPLLGVGRQGFYANFIENCNRAVQLEKPENERNEHQFACVGREEVRIKMNRFQPRSVYNFTELGYEKRRAPHDLFRVIQDFYSKNKEHAVDEWPSVNNYQNTWEAPSRIVRLEDQDLEGGGSNLQEYIWSSSKQVLEEWTGLELKPVSLYGVRQYHRGSVLAPHVDRMPLVISAIINVEQEEVEEPWPLEVYGHNGRATNVSMEVGDMILYESHSIIHGRPFPLVGNVYANVFLHFEPVDAFDESGESLYDPELDIPPYLIPESPWEDEWWEDNTHGWKGVDDFWEEDDARLAAHRGDIEVLQKIAEEDPDFLHEPDELGWHPLHEAARSGKLPALELLLEYGADINQPTIYGHTPLHISLEHHGEEHEMTKFLLDMGAVDAGPDF